MLTLRIMGTRTGGPDTRRSGFFERKQHLERHFPVEAEEAGLMTRIQRDE